MRDDGPMKSQILASKDLPSLSESFGRLRQATLFDSNSATFLSSNIDTLPSSDKSACATSMRSSRGDCGGWGQGRGGHEQDLCKWLTFIVRIIR